MYFQFYDYHPGLAEISAPVGSQEVVGHTLNAELLIGFPSISQEK